MRTTNANQEISMFQQKHLLKLHLVTPHGEERKPFSTHKSERWTAPSRAKPFGDGDNVWNTIHSTASAPSSQPVLCYYCSWAGCGPCCSILLGMMMVLWCKWIPTENHCADRLPPDHLHRFFLLWDRATLDGKFIHFYRGCSQGWWHSACCPAETYCAELNGTRR